MKGNSLDVFLPLVLESLTEHDIVKIAVTDNSEGWRTHLLAFCLEWLV